MEITHGRVGPLHVLTLTGHFDAEGAEHFKRLMVNYMFMTRRILLDLAGLKSIHSSEVIALVEAQLTMRPTLTNGQPTPLQGVILIGMPPRIEEALKAANVLWMFNIFGSINEVLENLAKDQPENKVDITISTLSSDLTFSWFTGIVVDVGDVRLGRQWLIVESAPDSWRDLKLARNETVEFPFPADHWSAGIQQLIAEHIVGEVVQFEAVTTSATIYYRLVRLATEQD